MAQSRGPIQVGDNDIFSINEALRQIVAWIDDISGLSDKTSIIIGPHVHQDTVNLSGGNITVDASTIDHALLADVTANQHHAQLHNTSHESGGGDSISIDSLAAASDNLLLNVSTLAHGLQPKLSGSSSDVLHGDGTYGPVTAAEATDITDIEGCTTTQIWEQVLAGTNITITEQANGEAILIDASGGSSSGMVDLFRQATVSFAGTWSSAVGGNFSTGFHFYCVKDVTVTALTIDWPGGVGALTVKGSIYDRGYSNTGGSLVGSATVAVNAAGLYTITFSSPLALTAGKVYAIQSWETSGTYYVNWNTGSNVVFVNLRQTWTFTGLGWSYFSLYHAGDAVVDTFGTDFHPMQMEAAFT